MDGVQAATRASLRPTQGRRRRGLDRDLDELARRGAAREVDRRVAPRPAAQHGGIGARRPFDEHLLDPADPGGVPLAGHPLRQLDESLHPLGLHLVRDLVGHHGGLGAVARRVDEGVRAVVADLFDDLERLAEVGLRLAWEADDDVGAEGKVGNGVAHALDECEIALARIGAPHRLQDSRRAGLEW